MNVSIASASARRAARKSRRAAGMFYPQDFKGPRSDVTESAQEQAVENSYCDSLWIIWLVRSVHRFETRLYRDIQ